MIKKKLNKKYSFTLNEFKNRSTRFVFISDFKTKKCTGFRLDAISNRFNNGLDPKLQNLHVMDGHKAKPNCTICPSESYFLKDTSYTEWGLERPNKVINVSNYNAHIQSRSSFLKDAITGEPVNVLLEEEDEDEC